MTRTTPAEDLERGAGPQRLAAVVLAAGCSSRTYPLHKLVAEIHGKPLAARAVDAALAVPGCEVVVVTGHRAEALRAALGPRRLRYVHNPAFATGLASSIRTGLQALDPAVEAALIVLADMPELTAAPLLALLRAFEASGRQSICVPVVGERRGNPVLWPRWAFGRLCALSGDIGGRRLLEECADRVQRVPLADDAVLHDVDTPEALAMFVASARRDAGRDEHG